MNTSMINVLLLATAFLLLFGIGELLYYVLKVKVEISRKFVHIATGFITLLFPLLLHNHWYVLLLCSSFCAILLLSQHFQLLKSINAIDRDSFGSISYPISVYGCFLAFTVYHSYLFFYLPILI